MSTYVYLSVYFKLSKINYLRSSSGQGATHPRLTSRPFYAYDTFYLRKYEKGLSNRKAQLVSIDCETKIYFGMSVLLFRNYIYVYITALKLGSRLDNNYTRYQGKYQFFFFQIMVHFDCSYMKKIIKKNQQTIS